MRIFCESVVSASTAANNRMNDFELMQAFHPSSFLESTLVRVNGRQATG